MDGVSAEDFGDRLAAEWEELAARAGASPFLRPGWFRAWQSAFGTGRVEVVTLRRDGALRGVLPTAVRGAVRTALVNWHTPELALLAESPADLGALAGGLLRRSPGMTDLLFVADGSESAAALARAAASARQRWLARVIERSPWIDLSAGREGWEAGLDHHLLTELRRRRRRLEGRGALRVQVATGERDLDALLDEGFAVEAAGWKGRGGTAIRAHPATLRFYTEVAHWAAARGWLRLAFLRSGDATLAFDYAIEQGGVHSLLKTGYDPAHAAVAPGKLLRQEMVARAFAAGLRSYEFLGNAEPWKLEWNVRLRDRVRLQAFRSSPAGLALWCAWAWGRPLLRRARRLRAPGSA